MRVTVRRIAWTTAALIFLFFVAREAGADVWAAGFIAALLVAFGSFIQPPLSQIRRSAKEARLTRQARAVLQKNRDWQQAMERAAEQPK